ncbi:sigma-70 family RNA polymerase sigma factor [Maritalea sp.]|uniref:sigma-70 family RNA polymerase sigma factor n=1 Tax=Maritalea sp. TaxID=2003361 RepID=UPI003EFAD346
MNFRLEDQFVVHIPALQRFARTLTGAPERADDLVQDCLERAIRKKSLFRQPNNPRAWLFKIMHNVYRNQVVKVRPTADIEELENLAEAPRQDGVMELTDVRAAMHFLSKEHQEILMLVAVEGLSYAEAADILNVQKGTIMSRLARARDHLRSIMNGERQQKGEAR